MWVEVWGQPPEEAERYTSKNLEQAERRSAPFRHTLTTGCVAP
jgi:hypothetical protein